ncbi:MAG: PhzF family phenazine biosynthesis protein [Bacillota bacterium]
MEFGTYIVDAFSGEPFKGNPAAVCILEEELSDDEMQKIAMELCLSETAFVVAAVDGSYKIRWFAPKTEIGLCGHATLAASKVLFDVHGVSSSKIIFESASGTLTAEKSGNMIRLDFPIDKPLKAEGYGDVKEALGVKNCKEIILGEKTRKLVMIVDTEQDIYELQPDYGTLSSMKADFKGIGVTAKGSGEVDFVSRYFNPWAGVNEDPVTGSVHTVLASYWSERLGKNLLKAYQASPRGGYIDIAIGVNDRVALSGEAVIVLRGSISI